MSCVMVRFAIDYPTIATCTTLVVTVCEHNEMLNNPHISHENVVLVVMYAAVDRRVSPT